MNRDLVLKNINKLIESWHKHAEAYNSLKIVENSLEAFLKEQPSDEEMLGKLALVNYSAPILGVPHGYLRKILDFNPDNIEALLVLAFIDHDYRPNYGILLRLEEIKVTDEEEQALIWYAKSLYYRKNHDYLNVENALNNSLTVYSGFVWPQIDLANYYKKKEIIKAATRYLSKLLQT